MKCDESKATEGFSDDSLKKVVNFNCGTSFVKDVGNNYNFAKSNLLIACIIQLLRTNISNRSSYKERKGNALASGADEGRDKLR